MPHASLTCPECGSAKVVCHRNESHVLCPGEPIVDSIPCAACRITAAAFSLGSIGVDRSRLVELHATMRADVEELARDVLAENVPVGDALDALARAFDRRS